MIHKNINEEQNNSRLDHAATSLFEDFSRSQIQRWISQGNLLVNGEILKAKDKVHTGDEMSLDPIFENRVSWEGRRHTY
jgi:23S rRNA pseudouridine1911/1915/1917 synthase